MGFSRQEYWTGVPLPSPKEGPAAKSLQSCPTLCDPIDGSSPGSTVPGILQAPPSLGFSRQEHWSRLPFPSPMHESEVMQSCPTLHDPMDCSQPGPSVLGILQARVLEWVAISFSRGSSQPRDQTQDSLRPHGILQARILEWVASPFPNQGLNSGLPHSRKSL